MPIKGNIEKLFQLIWLPGGVDTTSILRGEDELVTYKSNTETGG